MYNEIIMCGYNCIHNIIIGIEVQPFGTEQPFNLKVVLLGCAGDLPARAMLLNMMQFNSYYGCNFCKLSGKNISTDKGGHVQVFPYTTKDLVLRSKEVWYADAEKATSSSPVSILIIISIILIPCMPTS